ncbi:MAG: glycosyltransferase [Acutalibacteraceae bacterium]
MGKKAVCISCFHYYENRIKLIEEYLRNHGYQCTYITSDFDHIEKKVFSFKQQHAIQISTRPYCRNLSAARLISHYLFSRDAFRQVETIDPDLLFVMVPPNSIAKFAAKYKKKHSKVRLILDLYDLWPETFPNGKAKRLLAAPFALWRRVRDRGLNAADLITTECNLYQKVLQRQLGGKPTGVLYLCRSCATCAKLPDALSTKELNLCYLGSINNIIDIPTIAALLGEIAKLRPVKLHIIGDGESRDGLIDCAENAGAEVIFHGKIYDAAEKQKIFDICSFGINIMKASVCVGLTMKSLDYFAGGLPILNTIGGDTYELVEKRKIGLNVCREDIRRTAVLAAGVSVEENLQMRQNTLGVFNEIFSKEAFCAQLDRLLGKMQKKESNQWNTKAK